MQEELEERYERLTNVETIKENLGEAEERLRHEEIGGLETLREINNCLSAIEDFSAGYKSLKERLNSARLELEDIAGEIETELDKLEDDPESLQLANDRLQVLYNLQKKHEVSSVEELMEIRDELSAKVSVTENADEAIAKLEAELSTVESTTEKTATKLHESRKSAIPGFVASVEKNLFSLGMPDARLKIELKQTENFSSRGMDEMDWFFSANKGSAFKALKKTASGGELSRITLAIKSILAKYSKLPTIIFDEIDTGVSGEIAQKMGNIMASMGENMQVISITHLPQIAAKGNNHFKVYKETTGDATQTKIIKLSQEERIVELSAMLGGKEKQESATVHAKALLGQT
jgi:DNA repair protein RecN (Recombination protein N)